MKTVIDAVNEFKGCWPFTGKYFAIHGNKKQGWSYYHDKHSLSHFWDFVCTMNEFDKCMDSLIGNPLNLIKWKESKPVTSPIYTHKMKGNGELPSVGAEFILIYDELGSRFNSMNGSEVKIISISKCGVYTFKSKLTGLGALYLKPHHCEPITPPIELIDGERYEFDADTHTCLGFYYSDRNSFFTNKLKGNKICGKSEASNIKLLEVKS